MQIVGNAKAVTDSPIVIISEGAKDEYNVPKEVVEGFNGAEVILDATFDRIELSKVKVTR